MFLTKPQKFAMLILMKSKNKASNIIELTKPQKLAMLILTKPQNKAA